MDAVVGAFSEPTLRWQRTGTYHEIEGKRIFVHRAGPAKAPKVLLIHGFPTSSHDWQRVTAQLSDSFCCAAVDLPGYGLSDKPRAYSYSLFQQADVVEGVAQALGFSAAHVISHDVGTSLHTELLARNQEGRLRFQLLSSTFLNGSMLKSMAHLTDLQKLLEVPSQLDKAQELCDNLIPTYVDDIKLVMARPEAITDDDATVMTETMAYQHGNSRLPNIYSYVRERYLMQDRWMDALMNEKTPLQIAWAAADPIAVVEMGRAIHKMLPDAPYTEIPNSGHFTPIEQPDRIATAFRSFQATVE
ncbi:MAG: alpha/beta hydrolase [Mycobacterium sp.]|nr:alpha/beta hydrolase [Mycobacterium sp.]